MIATSVILSQLQEIMNIRKTAGTLLVAFVICDAAVGQGKTKRVHSEQRHFSAEVDSMENPVPIPDDVLSILKKDEGVLNILESDGIPSTSLSLLWFTAAAVHLHSPSQTDLIVMGIGELRGGNVNRFWVFRSAAHGYELVLNDSTHDLFVKNTRWKGYRDIELVSMTAVDVSTTLCRFNGHEYVGVRGKWELINGSKP